jgi:putative GTP pyrophosphokinase
MASESNIEQQFNDRLPQYKKLDAEVLFILSEAIKESGIKIEKIENRVKDLASLVAKCDENTIENLDDGPTDVVGARVITLFRSDLAKVDEIVRREFDVLRIDDKTGLLSPDGARGPIDSFGYMSIHYDCTLKSTATGRRYEGINKITFEIQVRTLCMHAWAAVSHHLDYKNEKDIPVHLQKELSALSGLFFVADSQFETGYAARQASKNMADREARATAAPGRPLDLDSLNAELANIFPDRLPAPASQVSSFLEELINAGINRTEALRKFVEEGTGFALAYEKRFPPERPLPGSTGRFSQSGIARLAVASQNEPFRHSVYTANGRLAALMKANGKIW